MVPPLPRNQSSSVAGVRLPTPPKLVHWLHAPPRYKLERAEALLNPVDHDGGADALDEAAGLAAWAGVPTERVSRTALRRARELRDALRDKGRDPTSSAAAARLAVADAAYPLRPGDPVAGEPPLVAIGEGADAAVGRVVADLATARVLGTEERLKLCPATGCGWAFVDRSRNGSKRWCEMNRCGNQQKVRAYRDRHGTRQR